MQLRRRPPMHLLHLGVHMGGGEAERAEAWDGAEAARLLHGDAEIEAAEAAYQATEEDQRDVKVALYAEVARAYLAIRGLQMQLKAAQNNIENRPSLQISLRQIEILPIAVGGSRHGLLGAAPPTYVRGIHAVA